MYMYTFIYKCTRCLYLFHMFAGNFPDIWIGRSLCGDLRIKLGHTQCSAVMAARPLTRRGGQPPYKVPLV